MNEIMLITIIAFTIGPVICFFGCLFTNISWNKLNDKEKIKQINDIKKHNKRMHKIYGKDCNEYKYIGMGEGYHVYKHHDGRIQYR